MRDQEMHLVKAEGEPDRPAETLDAHARRAEAADMVADLRDRLAREDDATAERRDRAAEKRDDTAGHRDRQSQDAALRRGLSTDHHPAARDRAAAAGDRKAAAKDRGRSSSERNEARQDRERASGDRTAASQALTAVEDHAEDMLVIGQAQGMIMHAQGTTAAQALLTIFRRASNDRTELIVAAHALINEHGGKGDGGKESADVADQMGTNQAPKLASSRSG